MFARVNLARRRYMHTSIDRCCCAYVDTKAGIDVKYFLLTNVKVITSLTLASLAVHLKFYLQSCMAGWTSNTI